LPQLLANSGHSMRVPQVVMPVMQVVIRILTAVTLMAAVACQPGSTHRVRLAVTKGPTHHLPIYLAEALGYYNQEGLDVTLHELEGGSRVMQALLGGSADVASGAYEQSIQIAAEGQRVRAFVTVFHGSGMVFVVSPQARRKIQTIADLKGATIGVTVPGSPSHLFANYLAARHGISPSDLTVVGIGNGVAAVLAIERGKVDVGVSGRGEMVVLRKRHPRLTVLADASTAAGARDIFAVDPYPSHVLYAKPEWLERNPDVARKLARAMKRTLTWTHGHSAEEIRQLMPEHLRMEDAEADLESIRSAIPMFSTDGLLPAEGAEAVRRVLAVSNEKVRNSRIDLRETFTNEFVQDR
jgi:NitT/TauT family transport system substrate-binding protein